MLAAVCAPTLSDRRLSPAAISGWLATLDLHFMARLSHGQLDKTVLKFRHQGPLRIQKALYPDGLECCHAVMIHPPGGIAAGDCLMLSIVADGQTHAVVTTPSATKWYGAFDAAMARQTIHMQVDGHLQWIPAETIVFDGARVQSALQINVSESGSMFGWDTQIYGRQASNEHFLNGSFDQTMRLSLDDELIWLDRLRLEGSDPLFSSPVGLQGHHALATCWAVVPGGAGLSQETLDLLRTAIPEMAFTSLHPRVLVGRLLGHPIDLRATLEKTWRWLHTYLFNKPIATPRLWAT